MKDKIINFLLIFLLIFLVLSMFSNQDKSVQLDGKIEFKPTDTSYSLPASPGLLITNNSSNNIILNTCKDIKVKTNGDYLKFDDSFCSDITINSGISHLVNYNNVYDSFSQIGDYTFVINYNGKEYLKPFVVGVSGFFKKFFVGVFYAPIYNLMVYLITLTGYSLFWAIVLITVLIRLLLVIPQHKMMKNQRQMQVIQPKIKEIQKKYKGNNQMLGVKLMELYKKEKVNPMGSCGLLLIQMPILIVVYRIIVGIEDPSNFFYIYSFLSNFDLSRLVTIFNGFDMLSVGGTYGLILAIIVAFLQFIQVKLSLVINKPSDAGIVLEKKKGESDYSSMMPDPEVMNKFMLIGMPIMVGIFTYTFFAGVGIYWGISTTFMIIQQLIVNKLKK